MEKERNNYRIGIYLERALLQKKWTTKQLAEKTGIDRDLIQRYIINKKCPSYSTIETIANAMDLPIEYFISDTFDQPHDLITEKNEGFELRAHIANSDLMINVIHGDEKSYENAFKALQKLNVQVFNTLTPEGKEKMILAMYRSLMDELYPIAFEEKNKENYWWYIFDDKSLVEREKTGDARTIYMMKEYLMKIIDKLAREEESEQIDSIENILSSTAIKLEKIDSKKDE